MATIFNFEHFNDWDLLWLPDSPDAFGRHNAFEPYEADVSARRNLTDGVNLQSKKDAVKLMQMFPSQVPLP